MSPSLCAPERPLSSMPGAAQCQCLGLDEWNARLSSVCGTFQTETPNGIVLGSVSASTLLGIEIADVHVGPSRIVRNQKAVRSDGAAYYFLIGQKEAQSHIQHNQRSILLRPGDLVLVDSSQESHFIYPGQHDTDRADSAADAAVSNQVSVHIPRQLLEGVLSPDQLGMRIDAGSDLAQCVWQQLKTLQEITDLLGDRRLQTERFRELFLNAFTQLFRTDRHQTRFVHIVLDLLQEAEGLSHGVDYFADRSATSRRTMTRLFAQRGTSLGELLRYARFLRFFRLCSGVAKASVRPSISSLIYQAGFSDVSNFNHLFKASFGLTPRELMARD